MSIRISSRNLILKEVEKSDIDVLWKWRNEKSFQENCTMRKNETALEEFERELFHDFEIDRHIQCIAFRKQDMLPVGTIYSYTYNKRDGHCFVTTYITPSFQNRWYGPEIFVGFLERRGLNEKCPACSYLTPGPFSFLKNIYILGREWPLLMSF